MDKSVNVDYTYKNNVCENLRVWMIKPTNTQNMKRSYVKPDQINILPTGEKLAYFELEKGQSLHMNFDVNEYIVDKERVLSKEDRFLYLRNTVLSPINDQIKKLALDITKNEEIDKEKAFSLFYYVVNNFKYVYPPKDRGATSFLKSKQGDCGEYSFLFTSLCRSIGIPARSVTGGWAYGKMNGHMWNEIFIKKEGWIPVDCSMAYLQKKKIFRFLFSNLSTLSWKKYFGQTEGQRIVFSKDTETELIPKYKDNDDKVFYNTDIMYINSNPFYWGQQSLNGKAPYLQPVYIELNSNSNNYRRKLVTLDILGEWKVREKGTRRLLLLLKNITFTLGLTTFLINLIQQNIYTEFLNTISFMTFALCFIFRKERVLLFSIIFIFMLLSLLSTLHPYTIG